MSMLGNLVHMRDDIEFAPVYVRPRTDGWMTRAIRAIFDKMRHHAH
jgi:hypothetical protein